MSDMTRKAAFLLEKEAQSLSGRERGRMPDDLGSPPPARPPMQWDRLHMVAETRAQKARLMALFFRIAKEHVAALREAGRAEAFLRWKNTAHSMKGAAANLGMDRLEDLCRQAENADAMTFDQRGALLAAITAELHCIRDYMAAHEPALLSPGDLHGA